jgi:hypothetical protein
MLEHVFISAAMVMGIWCGGKLLVLALRDGSKPALFSFHRRGGTTHRE